MENNPTSAPKSSSGNNYKILLYGLAAIASLGVIAFLIQAYGSLLGARSNPGNQDIEEHLIGGHLDISQLTDEHTLEFRATTSEGETISDTVTFNADSEGDMPPTGPAAAHISYQEIAHPDQALKYATNESGQWVSERIDQGEYTGSGTALAVDSNQNVHIAYNDNNALNASLNYVTNSSGEWEIQTIDSNPGTVGVGVEDIALSQDGHVYIAYGHTDNGPMYATNQSGSWVLESIPVEGGCNSMALDSSGNMHLACSSYRNNRSAEVVQYATNRSGTWQTTDVGIPNSGSQYYNPMPVVAVDSQDNPHLAYMLPTTTSPNRQLMHATNATGNWVSEVIDDSIDSQTVSQDAITISIGIDSQDIVHLSYFDDVPDALRYASNQSGTWTAETVDSEGLVGQFNSLSIDENDNIHISYLDDGNSNLKYATNVSGDWVLTVADSEGDVGSRTSIDTAK